MSKKVSQRRSKNEFKNDPKTDSKMESKIESKSDSKIDLKSDREKIKMDKIWKSRSMKLCPYPTYGQTLRTQTLNPKPYILSP